MTNNEPGTKKSGNGGNLGFEEKLWQAADQMRGHIDSGEYKHVALGLIFLKYVSDAFERKQNDLERLTADPSTEWYTDDPDLRNATKEDRDEYSAENVFWVPQEARWSYLHARAKLPEIGKLIDDAMYAIEQENKSLKGILPSNYSRPELNKQKLGELIDLISTISFTTGNGHSQDILGRVYEYFLGRFASAEGKNGGEFYTPQSVVSLLVEMLEPYKGRVYDPCCGSGGMFVQSEKFVQEHGGKVDDIAIYGQESNPTTWKLAKMNLAIRGVEGNLGSHNVDTLGNDLHRDLRADYILANPPFNIKVWGGEKLRDDARWVYGVPPVGNANFAWVQHIIYHLSPKGTAGFVLANGSLTSNTRGEGEIRKAIVDADLVDCIVYLPGNLFYTTPISACLWFVTRNKAGNGNSRSRRGETLFIETRKLGHLVDRTHRELSDEDIERVVNTYRAWRGEPSAGTYEDLKGFCKSSTIADIKAYDYSLLPGQYVGSQASANDESFEERMRILSKNLAEQFAISAQLEEKVRRNLRNLGYEV